METKAVWGDSPVSVALPPEAGFACLVVCPLMLVVTASQKCQVLVIQLGNWLMMSWGILKALNIDQVVLVGHSMGGMVAQQFCLDHAEQVRGLVLATTLVADRGNRLISKRIELDSRQEILSVAFDRHFDLWFLNRTSGDVRAGVKTQMRLTPELPAQALVRSYAGCDPTDRLQKIRSPTLVIGTQSDHSTSASCSQELAQLIPGSDLVLIDDCGHFPMQEKPEEISRELLAFIYKNAIAKRLA